MNTDSAMKPKQFPADPGTPLVSVQLTRPLELRFGTLNNFGRCIIVNIDVFGTTHRTAARLADPSRFEEDAESRRPDNA
jgi:class 3 adenylate cyclase